jgi:hypothetical protein
MTRRRKLIEDPRGPHRLRVGVAYRVVEESGNPVVRPTATAVTTRPQSFCDGRHNPPIAPSNLIISPHRRNDGS